MTRQRLFVLLLGLALVVAACGDSGGGPATTTTSGSDTSTTAGTHDVRVFWLTGPGDDCSAVAPATRTVQGSAVLTAAMRSLLAGPTPDEQARGLHSLFSERTAGMLRSARIEDGVARVDFADFSQVIPNASSSCGSQGLLAQLDATATQFPTVKRAVYSFDGDVAAFYEWLQLAPPDAA